MSDAADGDLRHVAAETLPSGPSPGAMLRAARERQGVHLAVLAASLKVTPKKLEQLEADRFDELPDATFARALALSVCRTLKIDPEPVMARLPQSGQARLARLDHVAQGLNQPFQDRESWRDDGSWTRHLSLPLVGAALLVLGALVVYFLPMGGWSGASMAPTAASNGGAGPAANGTAASAPVAVPPSASQAQASGTVSLPAEEAPQPPASAAAALPGAASAMARGALDGAASAASSASTGVLVVHARLESWMDVRDASGRVLISRTVAAGELLTLDGALPLRVIVGNARGTDLSLRGLPVALDAATRDNVARLELK